MARRASSVRRLTPWLSVVGLAVLAGAAGAASAMTAPTRTSAAAPTTSAPGSSCPPPDGAQTVTLNDMLPRPTISVPVGSSLVVIVPGWSWGEASDLTIVQPTALSETCSVLLPDRGRRAVVVAQSPGRTAITATVSPASDAMMPAWGAEVTVTRTVPPGSPSPSTSSSTTTTSMPPSLPPPGALSTDIGLPSTTVVAGSTVSGTLVVTNHTDETFNLTQGCKPFWEVGLQSATIPFNPAVPTVCELAPFYVNPGVNQLPFTMMASYEYCATSVRGVSPTFPACLANGEPPPLPAGSYQAVLVSQTSALSAEPVDVQVVAATG